jgi:SAM-dependent methyltransferase
MFETPTSPNDLYRHRLLQEVAACSPNRILEVGVGEGKFLRDAASLGAELVGVEPDAPSVERVRSKGYAVHLASAEELPFADASVDVTVFSYTAHHIADWPSALAEAMRVTRKAIIVLDPWHDERIPSQAVAAGFERWCRSIDRANGEVHHDNLGANELLGELTRDMGAWAVRLEYLLELVELGSTHLEEVAQKQLTKAKNPKLWQPLLNQLIHQAKHRGYSADGAILVRLMKRRSPVLLFNS